MSISLTPSAGQIDPLVQGLDESWLPGALGAKLIGTAYNLLYIILVNYVLQAIITGQIIDTFTSMREENEAVRYFYIIGCLNSLRFFVAFVCCI